MNGIRIPDAMEEGRAPDGTPFVRVPAPGYSVAKTFDCGQTFRFLPAEGDPACVRGTAFGREITVDGRIPDELTVSGTTGEEFRALWAPFLALDEPGEEAEAAILSAMPAVCPAPDAGEQMAEALAAGRGIRILRQEPWETLVSFILSQNNNIPRIRGIIARLCGACGRFPMPEDLLRIGAEGLYALGCGFRAGYLTDAAGRAASGEFDPGRLSALGYEEAREELTRIRGVGPKVAACVLLFGFHRTEAFPVDVWMKKCLARRFPAGFDPAPLGRFAGYAQQCLFYAERGRGRREETGG